MKINLSKFHFVELEEARIKAYYKDENKNLVLIEYKNYSNYYILSAEIKKDDEDKQYIELICASYKSNLFQGSTLKDILESITFKNPCVFETLVWNSKKRSYDWMPIDGNIANKIDEVDVLFIEAKSNVFHFHCDYISKNSKPRY